MIDALPAPHAPEGRQVADILLASGLTLAGFRGVLTSQLADLIRAIPLRMSLPTACLAVLRALLIVAFEDVWKPRCTATIDTEIRRGLTARQKRLLPEARPVVVRNHIANVPAVLHGEPHAHSLSFRGSLETQSLLWSRALRRFLQEF